MTELRGEVERRHDLDLVHEAGLLPRLGRLREAVEVGPRVRADVDAHGPGVALRAEVAPSVERIQRRQDLVQDALRERRVGPPVLGRQVPRRRALGARRQVELLSRRMRRVRDRVGELAADEEAPRLRQPREAAEVPLHEYRLRGGLVLPKVLLDALRVDLGALREEGLDAARPRRRRGLDDELLPAPFRGGVDRELRAVLYGRTVVDHRRRRRHFFGGARFHVIPLRITQILQRGRREDFAPRVPE